MTLCSNYFLKSQITAEGQTVQTGDLLCSVNPDEKAREGLFLTVSYLLLWSASSTQNLTLDLADVDTKDRDTYSHRVIFCTSLGFILLPLFGTFHV